MLSETYDSLSLYAAMMSYIASPIDYLLKLPVKMYVYQKNLVMNLTLWWSCGYGLSPWGRVMHICVSKLTIIGSDNGFLPGRRQAIIWTTASILLIRPLGTNFNEISIAILTFSFKKIHWKMASGKWRPFSFGLNVLTHCGLLTSYGDRDLGQHWLR